MNIGDKIKSRRKALGMTLEDVGAAVGVGKSTVRKWEQGIIKNMRRDKIAHLAAILSLDPTELIEYSDYPVSRDHSDGSILATDELQLLTAYRAADFRAREDALKMLLDHPASTQKESPA